MANQETPFIPAGASFLVYYEKVEKRGDFYLPESMQEQKGIVQVLAVGPKCEFVEPGDWVQLKQGGEMLEVNGKTYSIIQEYQIYGKYTTKPEEDGGITAPEGSGVNIKTDKTEAKAKAFEDKIMKK